MTLASICIPISRLWEILVDVGKGWRETENGADLSSACCCLPWIWRKTLPTCHCLAWSLQSSSQKTTEGFCHPFGFGATLAAVHLCVVFASTWHSQPGTQQPMHPWPLIFYCLTHPKALGSSLKPAISPHFSNYC